MSRWLRPHELDANARHRYCGMPQADDALARSLIITLAWPKSIIFVRTTEMRAVDQLSQVTDQRSFIAFVRILLAERVDPQTRAEWENDTIETYLEAAAAWVEAAPMQLPPLADAAAIWQTFAQFL